MGQLLAVSARFVIPVGITRADRHPLAMANVKEGQGRDLDDCEAGSLRAVKLATGERLWETFKPTTGGERGAPHATVFLTKNGDRYFLFSETGDLIIARLSPEKYEEISRAHLLDPTNEAFGRSVVWSHPAYANKCIFVRNDKEIVCASLAK